MSILTREQAIEALIRNEVQPTEKTRYTVAIGNSTTMQGKPSPDETCGHKHRTHEAACRCKEKLLNWSKDRKTCSAKWYGSYIVENTEDVHSRA